MFKSEKGTFLFSVFSQNCFLFLCIPIFHFLALLISAYKLSVEHDYYDLAIDFLKHIRYV